MGGSISFTVREADGTEHRMCRWTNQLPWAVTNLGMLEGRPEHVQEVVRLWHEMRADWEANNATGEFKIRMTPTYASEPGLLAPSCYGLVVVDHVRKVILTCQDYTAIGRINGVSFDSDDPEDPDSNFVRFKELVQAHRITHVEVRTKRERGIVTFDQTLTAERCRELSSPLAENRVLPIFHVNMHPFKVEEFRPTEYEKMRERVLELGFKLTPEDEAEWVTWAQVWR